LKKEGVDDLLFKLITRIKSYYWLCKYSKSSGELWRGVLCIDEDKSSILRHLDSRLERYGQMTVQPCSAQLKDLNLLTQLFAIGSPEICVLVYDLQRYRK